MKALISRRRRTGQAGVLLASVALATVGAVVPGAAADPGGNSPPVVATEGGPVRGATVGGINQFLGIPYAASPMGSLRWRPPEPAGRWAGVRDGTEYGPACPQPGGGFTPQGAMSEDCLSLNVFTPGTNGVQGGQRPVLVWIHGGGLTLDSARRYVPTQLAADGTVVVTINYRLGVLGFLSHPALASTEGGPSGNYGYMDQQAALRWVQRNIGRFGGDPSRVTIAGESAGGLSVLAHLVAPSSRGLFQRAIVESGSFALNQRTLASAEAFGETVAATAGCPEQTAACLRNLPVSNLVNAFPTFAIPGVVDGQVLQEPIGSALAAGRFAPVPVLNGVNFNEELIFVINPALVVPVSQGTFVPAEEPLTAESYQRVIKSTLGVSDARAAAVAAEYPASAYPSTLAAYSTLMSDANFACPALQTNIWTAVKAPTFLYQFDEAGPPRFAPLPVATHLSEVPYVFDVTNVPFNDPFTPAQAQLSASMVAAWANFAANGDPSSAAVPWPTFNGNGAGMTLVAPQPRLDTSFAARHHCPFWLAG